MAKHGRAEHAGGLPDLGDFHLPADRYMLIFWNHGGGSTSGVCFDETADYDGLTIHEINDVLYNFTEANPDFHLDLIGFDACLMATYEAAAHMQYYADFGSPAKNWSRRSAGIMRG